MLLIDTHLHLDEDAFTQDREEVLSRAAEAGVECMITIGTTADSSREAVQLAERYDAVYAAVGIQPNYVAEARPGDWDIIEELVGEPKVVAVGETGLDRYWDYAPLDLQIDFFQKHIELARQHDLPFVVHCREAEAVLLDQLRRAAETGPLHGVMHSFCGDAETARSCVDLGMYISFAGMLTYKKNDDLRTAAAAIPLDRLLVETDAPYLSPVPKRGKRNEPAFVRHTAACLAEIHELSAEDLATQTTTNARRLFSIETI